MTTPVSVTEGVFWTLFHKLSNHVQVLWSVIDSNINQKNILQKYLLRKINCHKCVLTLNSFIDVVEYRVNKYISINGWGSSISDHINISMFINSTCVVNSNNVMEAVGGLICSLTSAPPTVLADWWRSQRSSRQVNKFA